MKNIKTYVWSIMVISLFSCGMHEDLSPPSRKIQISAPVKDFYLEVMGSLAKEGIVPLYKEVKAIQIVEGDAWKFDVENVGICAFAQEVNTPISRFFADISQQSSQAGRYIYIKEDAPAVMQAVMVHEIGHCFLGLEHDDSSDNIMTTYVSKTFIADSYLAIQSLIKAYRQQKQ